MLINVINKNKIVETRYKFTDDRTSQYNVLWKKAFRQINKDKVSILEIGCHEGRSSCYFIDNFLHHKNSKLDCVDPYIEWFDGPNPADHYDTFLFNISQSMYPEKVTHYKIPSNKFFETYKSKYDFIFIDGDHELDQPYLDLKYSLNRVKLGGIICIDDIKMPGPFNAITKLFPNKDFACLFDGIKLNLNKSLYLKIKE